MKNNKIVIAIVLTAAVLGIYLYSRKRTQTVAEVSEPVEVPENVVSEENTTPTTEVTTDLTPNVSSTSTSGTNLSTTTNSQQPFGNLVFASSMSSGGEGYSTTSAGGGSLDWNTRHLQSVQKKLMSLRGVDVFAGSEGSINTSQSSAGYQESTTMLYFGY